MAAETGSLVEIEVVIGEDFAAQIFWTDEYSNPIPITDPVLMDVLDANGQIAMRFTSSSNVDTDPHLSFTGYIGFLQLTAPRSVTETLIPGSYAFDLFAAVSDSSAPFNRQIKQVISGYVTALPRVSRLEDAIALQEV